MNGCGHDKENIREAKKVMQFYIKTTPFLPYDCLANREREAAIDLLSYIKRLETKIQELEETIKFLNR